MSAVACGGTDPVTQDGAAPPDVARIPDGNIVLPPDARIIFDATPPPDASRPDASAWDCTAPLPSTVTWRLMPGFVASEDLAFDDVGNVIESDTINIYKTTMDGSRTTFVPNFHFRAGMRLTPAGDLIVNDDQSGSLVRVDSAGVRHTVLSGLSYPNGMEIDLDGFVYVAEQSANRVLRVNPLTSEYIVLTDDVIAAPNGIAFDQFYTALYIGGFSGVGTIYQLKVNGDGTPGALTPWATGVGTGSLDGIAVDICGNVYICDFGASDVIRLDPTGTTQTVIASTGMYLPNMQWGRGFGGWDPLKLYFPAVGNGLVEMDVNIPSKPRW